MVNILSKCVIKKDWFSAKYKFMVMKWRNSHQPAEPQDAQHLLTSSFSTWSRQRHPQDKLDKQPHTHTHTRPSTFCISIFLILRFYVCSPPTLTLTLTLTLHPGCVSAVSLSVWRRWQQQQVVVYWWLNGRSTSGKQRVKGQRCGPVHSTSVVHCDPLTLQPTANRVCSSRIATTVATAISLASSRTAGQNVSTSTEPEITMATRINIQRNHSNGIIHKIWAGKK